MIPGFVTIYKDNNGYVHLYFYQGIDDDETPIYRDIDMSNINADYDISINEDKSKDFKFFNKHIVKIHCKLILNKTGEEINTSLNI